MNRKIATALLIVAAVGNASADDISVDPTPFVSVKSRAEVREDLDRFKQAGINPWSMTYNPLQNLQSSKMRAEVTAEYLAARKEVMAITSEDSGSAYLMRMANRSTVGQNLAGQPDRNAE
jgi:hypothetical protein